MIKEEDIFKDYCLFFKKKLSDRINEMDFKGIEVQLSSLYEWYHNEIMKMSIYALTYELNNERINNSLHGETSRERFVYYENRFLNEEEINKFLNKYIVLKHLIDKKEEQTISFLSKIINDLNIDKLEVEEFFEIDISKIYDIKLGQGDTHNNGKTVVILEIANKKLVYKPHSLSSDVFMNGLINKINTGLTYRLKGIKVLDKMDHGYQEYKEFMELDNEYECQKLYYRLGSYLGLFYVMNSSDMHYENIIVCKDMPFVIDTETLMNPSAKLFKTQEDFIEKYNTLEDSVLITSLLPYKSEEGFIDIDLSGLFGETMTSKKMKTNKINDIGLDIMSISKELITNFVVVNKNKPAHFDVLDYRDYLIDGFKDLLKFIFDNKEEFIIYFKSKSISKMYFRQVLRDTMVYAKFLEASYHPNFLLNFDKRKTLFETLAKNTNKIQKIEEEIKALQNNDVPCFEICYIDNALYTEGRLVDSDFFSSTPKNSVLEKLEQLNEEKIMFQVELIKCSYNTKLKPFFADKVVANLSKKNYYKTNSEIYTSIFESFKNKEFYNFSTKGMDLVSCELLPDDQLITGINLSLYNGIGMLLSYLFYSNKCGKDKENQKFINGVINHYQLKKDKLQYGVFEGIGSVIYFLYNVCKLYKREDLYIQYIMVLNDLKNILENNTQKFNCDLIHGISGLIIILNNIRKDENDTVVIDDCLLLLFNILKIKLKEKKDISMYTVGLGHGISGINLACAVAYSFTDDNYFLNELNKLSLKEQKLINLKNINNSWCRGIGGIILSKIETLKILNIKELGGLDAMINLFLKGFTTVWSSCMCHGFAGNIEILNIIKNSNLDFSEELKRNIELKLSNAYSYINNSEKLNLGINKGFQLDSLMLGSSGVAYTFLRLDYPDLPSFLTLEI